jgi:uncharacterized protein YraI
MKKRVLVLLIVLALSAVSGLGITAAQGGGENTNLTAITTAEVSLYTSPDSSSDVVATVPAYTPVQILATDASGNWLKVASGDNEGYAAKDSFIILDLPLLAPKAYLATGGVSAALLSAPQSTSDRVATLSTDGLVGTVLGTSGIYNYMMTPQGTGWSFASNWKDMPEGATLALVVSPDNGVLGVYADASFTSALAGQAPDGSVLYELGTQSSFANVLLPDGTMGYASATNVTPLPPVMADLMGGGTAGSVLFKDAQLTADHLTPALPDGTPLVFIEATSDFWAKVYDPGYGVGYAVASNLGPKYTVGTVRTQDAVVRVGPNDNVYNAVTTLPAGTKVIVKGVSQSGAWYQVAIPFSDVRFGYNGVAGWMRDYLFKDANGQMDFDPSILSVTE